MNVDTPALTSASSPVTGTKDTAVSAPRILVVDDDEMIRRIVTAGLSRSGYQVDCVADGEEGWQALNANSYDLIITDYEMPRLCGLDLLRRMKTHGVSTPTLMVSGNMPVHERDFDSLAPAGCFLDKPFSLAQLTAHVQSRLNIQTGGGDFSFHRYAMDEKNSAAA